MSKELYSHLLNAGLLEYGSHIKAEEVRIVIGLEYPEVATKQEFDKLSLLELGAIDYVRSILINEGKYITQSKGDYRILLPSENVKQVEIYMSSADKKLRRALKLTRSSPKLDNFKPCNIEARILMKRDGLRGMK